MKAELTFILLLVLHAKHLLLGTLASAVFLIKGLGAVVHWMYKVRAIGVARPHFEYVISRVPTLFFHQEQGLPCSKLTLIDRQEGIEGGKETTTWELLPVLEAEGVA